MKWLRWQGLIVFIAVVILVIGVGFLFVDDAIEGIIERTGTRLVGAKVELGAADLSIAPLGLSLIGLQVTNPDAPMTNAVQVNRMALSVEGSRLLRRKVVVREMTLDGVRLDTPRKTSGAISRQRAASPAASKSVASERFKWPTLEVPSVKEILQREKLESLELIATVRTDLQRENDQWKSRLSELPDKAKLEGYRERIKKLRSEKQKGLEGVLGRAGDIIAVQKELTADLDRIKRARKELDKSVASLQKRMDEAAKAPQEDFRRLSRKYTLSPDGLINVSQLLFGAKISGWADTALRWYEKLAPLLQRAKERKGGAEVVKPLRGKGINVRFKEDDPLPDFLIRIAQVSVEIPAGFISGRIRNITPDQDVLGVPLTYEFSGDKLKGLESVKIDGTLDHVDASAAKDTANVQIRRFQIANMNLSNSSELPLVLKKATGNLKGLASLSGETFKADLSAGLQSVKIETGSQDKAGALVKAMASAFSDVKAFGVEANISGTLKAYDLQLSSDLDRVLKEAVGKQVKAQAARLQKDLQSAISEKVSKPMADMKANLGGLSAINSELAARLDIGNELLKGTKESGPSGLKLPF
ncbi:MAG TPA: TIGR03545 family protein [Desulfobacterales bacterium]|nr:TIGR03545 family protein [Desulfobacterales bacterium]